MTLPASPEELERLARQRAGAKLGWVLHAGIYLLVNLFVLVISRHGFGDRPWSPWPLAGWGLGLALHGVSVFLLGAGSPLRQRLLRQERERLLRKPEHP